MIAGGFGRASTGPSGAMAKSAVVRAYPLVRPAVGSLVRQASVQAAMLLRLVLCLLACRSAAVFWLNPSAQ